MQNYYFIYIENTCLLNTFNDEEIESVKNLDDFYNWVQNKKAKIIFISDQEIKNDILFVSQEEDAVILDKKSELLTYYPDYPIIIFSTIKKNIEEKINSTEEKKIIEITEEKPHIEIDSKKIFIRCFDSYISVKEEVDGEFISLKKFGEEKFKYEDNFWEWFKKKTGYENELLSFYVISDIEDFTIDPEINVGVFNLSKEESVLKKTISSTKNFPKNPPKKESLSEYYTNKTKLLREL